MDLQDILRCPRTGNRLRFEDMDRQFRGLTITRRGCDKSFAWFEGVKVC